MWINGRYLVDARKAPLADRLKDLEVFKGHFIYASVLPNEVEMKDINRRDLWLTEAVQECRRRRNTNSSFLKSTKVHLCNDC